ncbi:MAG: HK97 family phage prohead protease [Candidatus Woesearchaeota archaeon]|jgi:phage head maturation protease|nr:HK97 family phage prohead protease [Candidatus Woesearchaeota archaeon]
MIADLYEDGFLKTVSLGYNVLERDETDPRICSKTNLYECSFVAIPANTNAEKMDSISQDKMDKLVEL